MKNPLLIKSLFLGIFLTLLTNSCSPIDDNNTVEGTYLLNMKNNSIVFAKSSRSNWESKKVEVSFEDAFQKFSPIELYTEKGEKLGYGLSDNNLKQGLIIKIKITNSKTNSEKVNEIMLEGFDLEKGVNEFTIGCNENRAYIIY